MGAPAGFPPIAGIPASPAGDAAIHADRLPKVLERLRRKGGPMTFIRREQRRDGPPLPLRDMGMTETRIPFTGVSCVASAEDVRLGFFKADETVVYAPGNLLPGGDAPCSADGVVFGGRTWRVHAVRTVHLDGMVLLHVFSVREDGAA